MAAQELNETSAQIVLNNVATFMGDFLTKSGRYTYKNHLICDFVANKVGSRVTLFCSGGLRFKIVLIELKDGKIGGRVSISDSSSHLGPEAIVSIVTSFVEKVIANRARRKRQLEKARKEDRDEPGFVERVGVGFSVKAHDDWVDEREKISVNKSDSYFESAVKQKVYHQAFVTFCKENDVKCYYRPIEE